LRKFGAASTLGYIALRLDVRGLLRALANGTDVRGSPNVVFIPQGPAIATNSHSAGLSKDIRWHGLTNAGPVIARPLF
jgi:hypothetical protein